MGKHWIVLVNKAPKGPLSLEEVKSLLAEKIINRTDLALEVIEDSAEKKTEWKFLWQYPEFDLRLQNAQANPSKTNSTLTPENRRNSLSEEQLKSKVSQALPEEFALINPEDLVLTQKKNKFREPKTLELSSNDDGVDSLPYTPIRQGGFRWGYAIVALLVLVVGKYAKDFVSSPAMREAGSFISNVNRMPAKALPKPAEPVQQPKTVTMKEAVKPSSEKPVLPQKNEITLDEYQKLKEERAQKERREEEEREKEKLEAERLAEVEEEGVIESLGNEDSDQEENIDLPINKKKVAKKQKGKKKSRREISEESSDNDRSASDSSDSSRNSEEPDPRED